MTPYSEAVLSRVLIDFLDISTAFLSMPGTLRDDSPGWTVIILIPVSAASSAVDIISRMEASRILSVSEARFVSLIGECRENVIL